LIHFVLSELYTSGNAKRRAPKKCWTTKKSSTRVGEPVSCFCVSLKIKRTFPWFSFFFFFFSFPSLIYLCIYLFSCAYLIPYLNRPPLQLPPI
jgi:hypothetical protein